MESLGELRRTLIRRLIRRGALPQDEEDAVHDAFVFLCLAERKEHVRNPAAFLTAVLTKVRIERWRNARRHESVFVDKPVEEFEIIDLAPRPDECLQADQRLEHMWRRLGSLASPRTREVFLLHRLQGLSCREVAHGMRISVSAIEKHIARAVFVLADEREA